MLFLVHSDITAKTIQTSLGLPEYSYYFVLETYVEVLQEFGRVIVIHDPAAEADALFDEAQRAGEDCVLLAFAPPHRAPVGLRCPTLCVFAWEFSNLPDRPWGGEPRNDWRFVLRHHGRTICLSSYTERVVREVMGADFPVRAIPAPVYDRQAYPEPAVDGREPLSTIRLLEPDCTVIDNRFYEITAETFVNRSPAEYLNLPEWHGQNADLSYQLGTSESGLIGGFFEPESWGVWSRNAAPWVILPFRPSGRYKVSIELAPYGPNVSRIIRIGVGGRTESLQLSDNFTWHDFEFDFDPGTNLIQFSGIDSSGVADAIDPRGMGIGLRSIRLERISPPVSVGGDCLEATGVRPRLQIALDGIVYTSVLNPGDDRKNWGDMLTAFCHAFRDEPRATLLLKMTHRSLGAFLGSFHYLLQRIGPVQCRVVILHGFLDDAAYRQLTDSSTYCVNTSRCEGLCLPLMEYMSLGIPAVAPRHTAMLDYVNADNSFIVGSSLEPGVWPHDTEARIGTLRQRIDWRSLADAFSESFRVACNEPARYRRMSDAARAAQRSFCSRDVVRSRLKAFLGLDAVAAS